MLCRCRAALSDYFSSSPHFSFFLCTSVFLSSLPTSGPGQPLVLPTSGTGICTRHAHTHMHVFSQRTVHEEKQDGDEEMGTRIMWQSTCPNIKNVYNISLWQSQGALCVSEVAGFCWGGWKLMVNRCVCRMCRMNIVRVYCTYVHACLCCPLPLFFPTAKPITGPGPPCAVPHTGS